MGRLGITTPARRCRERFPADGRKTERLISLVEAVGGTTYLSGPRPPSYIEPATFSPSRHRRSSTRPTTTTPYPQLWGAFEPAVSILDLLSTPDPTRAITSRAAPPIEVPPVAGEPAMYDIAFGYYNSFAALGALVVYSPPAMGSPARYCSWSHRISSTRRSAAGWLWSSSPVAVRLHPVAPRRPMAGGKRLVLVLSIAVNLGALAYFKYAGFFVAQIAGLLEPLGIAPGAVAIIAPIGLSFIVFHGISLSVDVYRGEVRNAAEPRPAPALHSLLPQAPGRTDCPLQRLWPAARTPRHGSHPRRRYKWPRTGAPRVLQEVRHRRAARPVLARAQRARPWRSASRLCRRSLLRALPSRRFLRLHRYRPRCVAPPRHRAAAQLRSPVRRDQRLRILAPLAHEPVLLVPRLPLHSARRQPEGCLAPCSTSSSRWAFAASGMAPPGPLSSGA